MGNDKTLVYLDDLTTIEHLQPILRDLAQLGECEFWVCSSVNRSDERYAWFAAEAPGPISPVWPWERALDQFFASVIENTVSSVTKTSGRFSCAFEQGLATGG